MSKLAHEFHDPMQRLVFLVNNFDLITILLSEYSASCFGEEKEHFNEILDKNVKVYVEGELVPHFGLLMNFVMRTEVDNNALTIDSGKLFLFLRKQKKNKKY